VISNASSGIKALRLSDQFGPSAGSLYESGMDAMKDTVIQHGPQHVAGQGADLGAEISPLQSFFDSISGQNSGMNAEPKAADPKMQANLQQELKSTLATGKTWKPTEHLNNNRVASNTVQNRQEGDAKVSNADQKMSELKSNVQDIARKMDNGAANGPAQSGATGPAAPTLLGSLTGGLIRDAAVTGGLTAMGLPMAAAAYGAASLAVSVTGRGTFGVANSGEFSKPSTDRKGRTIDAGYTRSEASSPASGPAAQQANAVWDKLSQGPGFGRDGRKVDAESAGLAGQSLTGITALKLAENSPAMAAYKSQRLDGEEVHKIHEARIAKGLVADEPNVSRAMNIGLPDSALTQRAMLPGMHI